MLTGDQWAAWDAAGSPRTTSAPVMSPAPQTQFNRTTARVLSSDVLPCVSPRVISAEEENLARQAVGQHFFDILSGLNAELPAHPVDASHARAERLDTMGDMPLEFHSALRTAGGSGARRGGRRGRDWHRDCPGTRSGDAGRADAGRRRTGSQARPLSWQRAGDAPGADAQGADGFQDLTPQALTAHFASGVTITATQTVTIWPNSDGRAYSSPATTASGRRAT